jgi:uncharacterized membrane protein
MVNDDLFNIFAAVWFFICWIGYTHFARHKARTGYSLSSVLHIYRQQWMQIMMRRENRMTDAALVASLERNASFLASTSMFIIAGLLTITASTEQIHNTLTTLPFANQEMTPLQLQLKVILLLVNFVYAFLSLTWALRQYGFSAILLGAAPLYDDENISEEERNTYAVHIAKVIDNAGHSYNYGLRAFYFSLAILPWFFNTWIFIAAVTLVVFILYQREFNSSTLVTMTKNL